MNKRQKKKELRKLTQKLLGNFTQAELQKMADEAMARPYDHAFEAFCNKNGRCPCPDINCGYKETIPPEIKLTYERT